MMDMAAAAADGASSFPLLMRRLRQHPGVVPLLFCAYNAGQPGSKARAHNVLVALLVFCVAELLTQLGWPGVGWGLVGPPALAAGVGVPLYILLVRTLAPA